MAEQSKPSIGALWLNRSAKGTTYYTGEVTVNGQKIELVAFINSRKEKDTQPDIRIYVREPYQGKSKPKESEDNQEAINNIQKDEPAIEYPDEEINPEDIPF